MIRALLHTELAPYALELEIVETTRTWRYNRRFAIGHSWRQYRCHASVKDLLLVCRHYHARGQSRTDQKPPAIHFDHLSAPFPQTAPQSKHATHFERSIVPFATSMHCALHARAQSPHFTHFDESITGFVNDTLDA